MDRVGVVFAVASVCLIGVLACGPERDAPGSDAGSSGTDAPEPSRDVPPGLAEAGAPPERFAAGRQGFRQYCAPCHLVQVPADRQPVPGSLPAPPAFAVADHYRKALDDPGERIEAIVAFVRRPRPETALMPGAVRRFGAMAPMPLPDEELRAIATWLALAELDAPPWYQQHYREEHGPGPASP